MVLIAVTVALPMARVRATNLRPDEWKTRRVWAIGDATVKASHPLQNFGTSDWLRIRAGESQESAYIKFRLPKQVTDANLEGVEMWLTSPTGDGCLEPWWPTDIYRTTSDWNERSITWATAPPPLFYEGSADYFDDGVVLADITSDVSTDVSSTRVISYLMRMPENCTVSRSTRYRSTEYPGTGPYLEVTFSPAG